MMARIIAPSAANLKFLMTNTRATMMRTLNGHTSGNPTMNVPVISRDPFANMPEST